MYKEYNIEKLYDQFSRKLYFTSLRIMADTFEAEEAMHDTFLKLHNYHKKHEIENIESWLTKVCIRISIDRLRKKRELPCAPPPEEEQESSNNQIEKIKGAILSLPDGYRLILTLHLFEGYDYEEIAQITGVKEASVRSQYLRAKKKLAEIMSDKAKLKSNKE